MARPPATAATAAACAWARVGRSATSASSPTAAAASAPREKLRYTPRASGAHAAAAAVRTAAGRARSPAIRAASTNPIAASAPVAFQYVSGCSRRPPARSLAARWTTPGSSRPASP
jgi:hypothetical protein